MSYTSDRSIAPTTKSFSSKSLVTSSVRGGPQSSIDKLYSNSNPDDPRKKYFNPTLGFFNRDETPKHFTHNSKRNSNARNEEISIFEHDKSGCWEIFVDFCLWTSTHGLPQIGRVTHFSGRILWIISFALCCLVTIVTFYLLVARYLTHERSTDIKETFSVLPFPAVTVCSLSPYKRSKIENIPNLEEIIRLYTSQFMEKDLASARTASRPANKKIAGNIASITGSVLSQKDMSTPRNLLDTNFVTPESIIHSDNDTSDAQLQTDAKLQRKKRQQISLFLSYCECKSKTNCQEKIGAASVDCVCERSGKYACQSCTADSCAFDTDSMVEMATDVPVAAVIMEDPKYTFQKEADPLAAQAQVTEHLNQHIAALTEEEKIAIGYDRSELITQCSFNATGCEKNGSVSPWTRITNYKYGNCYTFNDNLPVNYYSVRAGALYGLRFMLKTNKSEALPTEKTEGARLVIHQQQTEPFPDTFGYNVLAGTISSFTVRKTKRTHLPVPESNCFEERDLADLNGMPEYFYSGRFTLEGCLRSCFQAKVNSDCLCVDYRYPTILNSIPCAINDTILECISNTSKKVAYDGTCSSCLPPCKTVNFDLTISMANWDDIKCETGECLKEDPRISTQVIEVYFERLVTTHMEETLVYPPITLLSDLGGQIGFWIGVSMISIVEFCAYSWTTARTVCGGKEFTPNQI